MIPPSQRELDEVLQKFQEEIRPLVPRWAERLIQAGLGAGVVVNVVNAVTSDAPWLNALVVIAIVVIACGLRYVLRAAEAAEAARLASVTCLENLEKVAAEMTIYRDWYQDQKKKHEAR